MTSQVKRAYSRKAWRGSTASATLALGMAALSLGTGAASAAAPEIRTSAQNKVPACVTPQRLMSFLKSRNPSLDPRFNAIANLYKWHGERWHVRWDYAFYQMAVETNFLSYKQGNGRWGDVDLKQNNFAGLGTTGGGVPGDSYPDVTTGVLAQIQHLVAYSGEHVTDPVGARTKLKQDDIIESMAPLKGHVTFNDLSRRWAVDRHYGASIEWVAGGYRAMYCKPGMQRADAEDKTEAGAKLAPKPIAKPATALAPAEALGGPTTVAETATEAAPEATAPAEAASGTEPATVQVATASPDTSSATLVRTIWSRDKQDMSPPTPETAEAGSAAAPATAAETTKPAPVAKTQSAQRTAPLPVAKAAMMAAAPAVVATAETPPAPATAEARTSDAQPPEVALAAADATVLAVPGVKPEPPETPEPAAAAAPVASHAPEELPAEMPKPAVVSAPVTAAIDAAPEAPRAVATATPVLDPPVGTRVTAFAPAINLVELKSSAQPKPAAATPTGACRVLTASYGGQKTLLVRTRAGTETHYTALTVLEGFEGSMLNNFVKAHASGGTSIGEYETKDAALAKARELCPGSAGAPTAEGASAG